MTVTALVSGGKDSIYAAYLSECQGWPVDELVTLRPRDPDSPMFHTPNLDLVELQARAWGKTHRAVPVDGVGEPAELAALEGALAGTPGPIVAGAIESSYQWSRLVRIGDRVRRRTYAPLWRRPPDRVVREEIAAGLDIRFVHLAAEGLDPALLGERLDAHWLDRRLALRGSGPTVHPAGEGGEFETLVVDAPFFRARIRWDEVERVTTASTARLIVRRSTLVPKPSDGPSGGAG